MSNVYLELHERGLTYGQIANKLGVSRNVVAGSIFRAKNPRYHVNREWRGGFRDPDLVKQCVELVEALGLRRAARCLGMSAGQLSRWRQRLRAMEAA